MGEYLRLLTSLCRYAKSSVRAASSSSVRDGDGSITSSSSGCSSKTWLCSSVCLKQTPKSSSRQRPRSKHHTRELRIYSRAHRFVDFVRLQATTNGTLPPRRRTRAAWSARSVTASWGSSSSSSTTAWHSFLTSGKCTQHYLCVIIANISHPGCLSSSASCTSSSKSSRSSLERSTASTQRTSACRSSACSLAS